MRTSNLSKNILLSDKTAIADSFVSRMVGLLDRKEFHEGEALVITHCQSIHMFFMRFAIDVVFVDSQDAVVGLVERIPPFGLSRIYFKASYVIELPAGTIERTKTEVGDKIKIGE